MTNDIFLYKVSDAHLFLKIFWEQNNLFFNFIMIYCSLKQIFKNRNKFYLKHCLVHTGTTNC
mgnify:CR=1 FL=1